MASSPAETQAVEVLTPHICVSEEYKLGNPKGNLLVLHAVIARDRADSGKE